ncbi:ATP-dependent Clp protease adapter ClpS [Candidatus Venteria ishoeyi]|uniref:ATP-dependent Clp protease adapter protein ClpS n=1 Tax=Candidatus Venteria ishoeyi TaxID=1899563 RepID=A0A1H6FGA6_9GAMM|nr:ATP-dependent Clp protease adapter ClpS [Candidatus Venteria ishoeyi]SEH09067.1 ATP-dependent Clp protease adapter protein ClpS [Candidatus Venteria ishoeyi]
MTTRFLQKSEYSAWEAQCSLIFNSQPPFTEDIDDDIAVQEAQPKLKKPQLYKVVLLNDDYTPMDFVIEILERFFNMNRETAVHVMLNVHTKGKGICGTFTRDIAETKVTQVSEYASQHEHPLRCTLEPA